MAENHFYNQGFIESLIELIQTNIGNEKFGARELAEAAGMSQRKLSFKLRTIKNTSVSSFIRDIRLQKALELLQSDDVTASEVAYKVGFSSATYFNKCFHEYYGYPPGKIRKEDFYNSEQPNLFKRMSHYLSGKSLLRKVEYAFGGLIVIAGLLLLTDYIFVSKSPANDSTIKSKNLERSIAVLPFKNLSDSTANQYFIDGVMEEILISLSKIHDLRVVSRTSVEQFRGSKISTSEIAKKLKVAYIVEGSGQKYGNRFRLRVQLIETSTDKDIWAKFYEQEISEPRDIFNIQSEVAQSVASALKARITPEEKQIIEKTPTTNLTAYDFYQRGNDELNKDMWPEFNQRAVNKAQAFFYESLKYDSTFAPAYTGLAEVLWVKRDRDSTIKESKILNNYLDSMLVLSDIALKYDNQLSEAYFIRGVYFSLKGAEKQVIEECDKAIRYNPNYYRAYVMKGGIYEDLDISKSLENFQKAASLNHGPELTNILSRIGHDYYIAGFPDKGNYFLREVLKLDRDSLRYFNSVISYEAEINGELNKGIEYYKKRYLTDSTNASLLIRLGYYNSLIGNYQESLKYYKRYISILKVSSGSNPWVKLMMEYLIGYAYMQNGYRKESDFYFNKSINTYNSLIKLERPGVKRYYFYRLAGIYAYRGNKLKAYENLNRIKHEQSFSLGEVTLIKKDPLFNSIRNEPEFQKIVRDIEEKYRAEHERVRKWMKEKGEL